MKCAHKKYNKFNQCVVVDILNKFALPLMRL